MRNLILLLALCFVFGCEEPKEELPTRPKNVILMVGDGMGLSQITAGMYANGNTLNLERCKVVGLHKPHASNNLITDSAAGATAFACGVKTYNGAIGVDADKQPVKTILEIAEENNKATGLIATSTITHATPASFIAHQEQRKMMEEIAMDFTKTEVDIFIGGGQKYFEIRSDSLNLSDTLRANNYAVGDYFTGVLDSLEVKEGQNVAYYTANEQPSMFSEGRDYLMGSSEYAIDFLNNQPEDGFFLMIEGSQIDWGGHANDADYIVSEMIEFDNTIGKVLDFAAQDGETLVIITADHETGGFAINYGSKMDSLVTAFTSDYHTAVMIPVFAFGPMSEQFSGIYENTTIFDKMKNAFGFE